MFIPLNDKNPLDKIKFQYVTFSLVVINILVFIFFQNGLSGLKGIQASLGFALVPIELFSVGIFQTFSTAPFEKLSIPEGGTLISYMFLHGSIMHLVGNMAFLWVFGDNVEDAMGHFRFLIFYLLCGIFAGLAHSWIDPLSDSPLIGASGAVSGVIVAYLMLHPNIRVWVLVLFRIPIPLPAGIVLSFWVIMQFISLYMQQTGQLAGNTAWMAHVGGVIAGAVLVIFMRRPGWKLFDFNH